MSAGELFWLKVAFAAVVAGVGLAGTLLPWVLDGRHERERWLAVSDSFAGGVLGGAGLVHLLSGGIDAFHAGLPSVAYPLALLLAGAGFLLILLIEGVIVADGPQQQDAGAPGSPALQHEADWSPGRPTPEAGRAATHPVILLVVLSVHSVVLGLALGAQRSLAGAVVVLVAIVAHKGAAGFALGVGYQRAGFARHRALPRVSLFSSMTPLGIVVGAGVGLALTGRADVLFEAVFDSLGAGTFLYIAALDIIKTEFDSPSFHGQKWLAAASGFGVMALLAVWL